MIIFDLRCSSEHVFEGWFRNSEEYEQQLAAGMLTCPLCGSENIIKLPTSHISTNPVRSEITDNMDSRPYTIDTSTEANDDTSHIISAINTYTDQLQEYMENHSENVGTDFPEEARKIHYGETHQRTIHGEARLQEVLDLEEEGISTHILPFARKRRKDLN